MSISIDKNALIKFAIYKLTFTENSCIKYTFFKVTFLNLEPFKITPEKSDKKIFVVLNEHFLNLDPLRFTLKNIVLLNDNLEEIDFDSSKLE